MAGTQRHGDASATLLGPLLDRIVYHGKPTARVKNSVNGAVMRHISA